MPLTEAAHWIASKGGTLAIGIAEQFWKPAFDELVARIESEDVKVIGQRGAGNEDVPVHLFSRIRIAYPYFDLPFSMLIGDGPYLDCSPFVDDDHWQREFNDKLYSSGRAQWTHLQVRKSDIARSWPFTQDDADRFAAKDERATTLHLKPVRGRAGRKPDYDWSDVEQFALKQLDANGDFKEWDTEWKSQAELERQVSAYIAQTHDGKMPATSTVRQHVSRIVRRWREGPPSAGN